MTLSTRIASAEVGSRELDAEIAVSTRWPPMGNIKHWVNGEELEVRGGGFVGLKNIPDNEWLSPPVTTSLDASLALAERVLPGWWFTVGRCGLTCHASVGPDRAFIQEPELSLYDDGFNADLPNPSTPALALCAAILKAVESEK